jgi:phospholipase C
VCFVPVVPISRVLWSVRLPGPDSGAKSWSLTRVSGWYDLTLTVDGDATFAYHAAGHVENGEDSISDPLMGGLV